MSESTSNLASTTTLLPNVENTEIEQTDFSPFDEPIIRREFEEVEHFTESQPTESDFDDEEEVGEFVPNSNLEEEELEKEKQKLFNPQLAEITSKTVLEIASRLLPRLAYHFAEIDTTELEYGEVEISQETLDKFEEINTNNREALQESIADNMQLLEAPMKLVMEKRNLNVSPETTLVFTLIFVVASIAIDTYSMREKNNKLIAQIIALNTPKKEEKTESKTEKVEETKTEITEKKPNEQNL